MRPIVLVAVLLTFPAVADAADYDFGIRVGQYLDASEAFIGIEALTPISRSFYFNPNLEWVLIDGGDMATLNGDVHYDFDMDGSENFFWAGAGLALLYQNTSGSDTDFGANVLAGIGRKFGGLIGYAQAKALIADNNDLVIGVGVRF